MNFIPWRRQSVSPSERTLSLRALTQALQREKEVQALLEATTNERRSNHFGERLHNSMKGHA